MKDEERISDLLLRWEEAQERGDDLNAETLCADCPELLEVVRKRIAALRRMSWMTRSQSQTDEPDPKVGTTLAGRYRIDELIGEGGHGKVYRGFDPELQRSVAIKLPNDRRVNTSDLLEEARKVARLRHPGIVTVYDVGQHEGEPFIVSDFVSGTTLCEAGPFTPQEAAGLISEIADSLHAAHEQGFVHRDIKPANILIDQQGRPLLTDFGIATVAGESQAQIVGTLPFMAPEQLGDDPANGDPRTDIWSLGVVLYELLTGKLPFDDLSPAKLCEQIRSHVPLPPRGINPHIPPALEAVVLRCLSKAPEERYESAQQLANEIRGANHSKSKTRNNLLIMGILTVLVAALAVMERQKGWFRSVESFPTPILSLTFDDNVLSDQLRTSWARYDSGIEGQAAKFEQRKSLLVPCTLPEGKSPRTLSAWIKNEGISEARNSHAIAYGKTEQGRRAWGIYHANGRWCTHGWGRQYQAEALTDTEWHHHCLAYDGKKLVYWFDGQFAGAVEVALHTTAGPLVLGSDSQGSAYFSFTGLIDDVRVYDVALSEQQIIQLASRKSAETPR